MRWAVSNLNDFDVFFLEKDYRNVYIDKIRVSAQKRMKQAIFKRVCDDVL